MDGNFGHSPLLWMGGSIHYFWVDLFGKSDIFGSAKNFSGELIFLGRTRNERNKFNHMRCLHFFRLATIMK